MYVKERRLRFSLVNRVVVDSREGNARCVDQRVGEKSDEHQHGQPFAIFLLGLYCELFKRVRRTRKGRVPTPLICYFFRDQHGDSTLLNLREVV